MGNDEREIRELIATWMQATRDGDTDKVLSLMTDDAVFLLPGHIMRKADFAATARKQAGPGGPQIDGSSEIQELKILGDWAFMWTRLQVVVTPSGGAPVIRAGHTLTILARQQGKWLLARDANLLVPVANP